MGKRVGVVGAYQQQSTPYVRGSLILLFTLFGVHAENRLGSWNS